jgi:GNAT superfamily N-acetyltransferase
MWWRIKRSQWEEQKGEKNRHAFHDYVENGGRPGLLAFSDREPVGWIAIEPREKYPVLERSRTLQPVDEEKVWSITCFFIRRDWRGRGVGQTLVRAAIEYVGRKRGRIIEAYPVEPASENRLPDAFAWHGVLSMFEREGFVEVARRSPTRPIVRYSLRNASQRRRGRPHNRVAGL